MKEPIHDGHQYQEHLGEGLQFAGMHYNIIIEQFLLSIKLCTRRRECKMLRPQRPSSVAMHKVHVRLGPIYLITHISFYLLFGCQKELHPVAFPVQCHFRYHLLPYAALVPFVCSLPQHPCLHSD